MYRLLVFLFSMMVIVYILVSHTKVLSTLMLLLSLMALAFVALYRDQKTYESYVDAPSKAEKKWVPISTQEDISKISKGLKFYVTAFNDTSYPDFGRMWINVAPKSTDHTGPTCATGPSKPNTGLTFEINPVFSRHSGFYLGNNRAIGPLSSDLGIQFHNTFTIMFMIKFGNLVPGNVNSEIDILKLYANSSNNNALALYIRKNSLQVINNVQMGRLMFQLSDLPPEECYINVDDSLMTFDKDIVMLFYIIKDIDSIRIVQMTEKSNTIVNKLLLMNFSNDDVTFSNKEMVINRFSNLNANIYNFAIFNYAMTDDDVTKTFNNLTTSYLKEINESYGTTVNLYNDAVDHINTLNACPADNQTCKACGEVTNWCGTNNMLLATKDCKISLYNFCISNPKHDMCKCWNKEATYYNSDACRKFRSIFMDNPQKYYDELSVDDLEYIKKKYKLLHPDECPKDITKKEMGTNKYSDYKLNKLQVDVDTGLERPKIKRLDNTNTTDPDLQEMMIQRPNKALGLTPDMYVSDPNILKDHLDEHDRDPPQDCRDKNLGRIREVPRGTPLIPTEGAMATDTPGADVAADGQVVDNMLNKRPDSFFNKFMKVIIGGGN
jgi:hypothetical protein